MANDANGNPQRLVFGADPNEPNDARTNATFIGSGANLNSDNLSIFSATTENVPPYAPINDQDWYQFVASDTGTLDFQVYFEMYPAGLLPGNGDLNIQVLDSDGTLIGTGTAIIDPGSGLPIGERLAMPVVRNQTYFLRVFGAHRRRRGQPSAVNGYEMTVINVPAPVPQTIDLQAASDSGRSDTDDITNDTTPTFDIVLDDDRIDEFLNLNLLPDTVNDNAQTPGFDYGVQVFNNGAPIGFAFYTGVGNTWQFTATAGTINEGHNNFITAAVWIRDRATPNVIGTSDQQGPVNALQITLDTIAPPVAFGEPGVANDGLSPDSDSGVITTPATNTDRITNDTTPTFFGRAEADAIIRVYADTNFNGIIEPGIDVFLGQTTAIPLDGDEAFPNGYWELTSTVDLNNPNFFPRDGLRQLLVSAEDIPGNVNNPNDGVPFDPDQILHIFIDTQGPTVDNVFIPAFPNFNLFQTKPNGANGPTPLTDKISIKFTDLPPRIAEFLYNAVQNDVALSPGNYSLVGDANGVIPIKSVSIQNMVAPGQPAMAVVTLTFFNPLPDDRFTLTVSDHIPDPAGNALDGNRDGQPGGDYVARFTVDSRPEVAVYSGNTVSADINGNFVFDPQNVDFTNRDLDFDFGQATDTRFTGKFGAASPVTGLRFDVLAAYGYVSGVGFRFLIDVNGNGAFDAGDLNITSVPQINGVPVAGNFDNNAANGDEVGVFDGVNWWLDTDHNFTLDTTVTAAAVVSGFSSQGGRPIVGDFDGDGKDDLGNFINGNFVFDLAVDGFGTGINAAFAVDYPGVGEFPVAADMDVDGIDDVGLWIPETGTQQSGGEWRFLISNDPTATKRIPGTVVTLNHPFDPTPLGADLSVHFGNNFALPLVGNLDPPVGEVSAADIAAPDIIGRTSDGDWWLAHNSGSGLDSQHYGSWAPVGWNDVMTGDFNNDGLTDVIGRTDGGQWWLGQNSVTGFTNVYLGSWASLDWHDVMSGDFNGDGWLDVLGRTDGGQWWLASNNSGNGFVNQHVGDWYEPVGWNDVMSGDFNGDGSLDLLGRTDSGQWWLGANNGSGGFNNVYQGAWANLGWNDIQAGDFNGDGQLDILGMSAAGQWWLGSNNGAGFDNVYYGSWANLGWQDLQIGDFNNDGQLDVLGLSGAGQWWLGSNNGAGFDNVYLGAWANMGWQSISAGDFNADGNLDVIGLAANGQWWLAANNGSGSFNNQLYGAWSNAVIWEDVLTADLDFHSSGVQSEVSGVSPDDLALAAALSGGQSSSKHADATDQALADETLWSQM